MTLRRGDCLRAPDSIAVTVWNRGPGELALLDLTTYERQPPQGDAPKVTLHLEEELGLAAWTSSETIAIAVAFERVVLEPGAILASPAGLVQSVAAEDPRDIFALGVATEGAVVNGTDRPVAVLVVTAAPAEAGQATPVN